MNIRFFNARILTMEEGRKIFSGEVWVSGDRILYVGEGRSNDDIFQELKIPVIIWDREIDCNGNPADAGIQGCTYAFRNDPAEILCR